MQAFGIWSEESGGFVAGPEYGREAARTLLYETVAQNPSARLEVVEMCPDHVNEEQPKDGCEFCS